MGNCFIVRKSGVKTPTVQFSSSFSNYGGSDDTFVYYFNLPSKNDLYKHFKFNNNRVVLKIKNNNCSFLIL